MCSPNSEDIQSDLAGYCESHSLNPSTSLFYCQMYDVQTLYTRHCRSVCAPTRVHPSDTASSAQYTLDL